MNSILTESKPAFLASLEVIMLRHEAVAHGLFKTSFEKLSADQFTAPEFQQVVNFATEQFALHQVKWLFSPASAPNTDASAEMEAWEHIWTVFSKTLIDQVPGADQALRQQHELTAVQYILRHKVQLDSAAIGAKFTSPFLSRMARFLNAIGLCGIGRKLYGVALYPAGTVGRATR